MTQMKRLPFFILLFLSLLFLSYAEVQCNNGLVNLCDLRQSAKNGYTISLGDYEYTTNIAQVLNRTEEECSGIQPTTISIQKLKGKKQCYSLGDSNFQVITFINPEDPLKGVKLQYRGGTEGRSTTLVLPCDPSMVSAPAIKRISEPYRLNYEFEFYPMKAACPLVTTATLPYTNDLTLHPSSSKVFRVPVDSSTVSLKIELSLSVGDLETRAVDDTMSQYLSRLGVHDVIGSSIFIHTRRGKIPTPSTHDYSTYLSPTGNPNHRTLFIKGNPYLTPGDVYIALYGGARIPPSVTVHFEVNPQKCISCNARGELDCNNQICKCESPYIYEDCSGELKNISIGMPQTAEKVPNNFWTVYHFARQTHQIYFNVILESSENDAPILFVSQGTVPTIDNYLASDGYGQNKVVSYGGFYRVYGVKERHLSIEVDEDSDLNLYVGVFGGTTLAQDSEGGVLDRTNVTDYKYSIVVESYACKNNCSGPAAGRCNTETHKCHCHSGYAGKSCSINSKQMSLGSSRDFVISPGNFEYFETTPKSDAFINISITSRDGNRPLKDVVIFVGDGYLPSSENFLASSHKPDQNEDFVGEIEVEEGDQIDIESLTGGADMVEDLRYSLQLLPRRKKVKYFIAVWNRDPVYHPMTLTLTEIDYHGGLGSVKATFLSIMMLLAGVILGAAMTVYRDQILVYVARAQGKIRTATNSIPFIGGTQAFMPSTRFANTVNTQPDDDENIFIPDESDDVFE